MSDIEILKQETQTENNEIRSQPMRKIQMDNICNKTGWFDLVWKLV